jgi:hypothetical protein
VEFVDWVCALLGHTSKGNKRQLKYLVKAILSAIVSLGGLHNSLFGSLDTAPGQAKFDSQPENIRRDSPG